MSAACTDILMYHSISDAPGPTSISPQIFSAQMDAIADAGVAVISMDDLADRLGRGALAPRAVAITFDDGFSDFAKVAWPILRVHNFAATVYLPTGLVGGHERWRHCQSPPRQLMDWATVRDLAHAGVCFGSHSVTHADLTAIDSDELRAELEQSKTRIETETARPAHHFAVPYGRSNSRVIEHIAQLYATSVGTVLGTANARDNIHDLPRLEMLYFTDTARWQTHLAGKGGAYLARRKVLRRIGQVVRFVPRPAPDGEKPAEQGTRR